MPRLCVRGLRLSRVLRINCPQVDEQAMNAIRRRRRVRVARSQGDLATLGRLEEEQLRAQMRNEAETHRLGSSPPTVTALILAQLRRSLLNQP